MVIILFYLQVILINQVSKLVMKYKYCLEMKKIWQELVLLRVSVHLLKQLTLILYLICLVYHLIPDEQIIKKYDLRRIIKRATSSSVDIEFGNNVLTSDITNVYNDSR